MELKLLSWNLESRGGNSTNKIKAIIELCNEHNPDILFLTECSKEMRKEIQKEFNETYLNNIDFKDDLLKRNFTDWGFPNLDINLKKQKQVGRSSLVFFIKKSIPFEWSLETKDKCCSFLSIFIPEFEKSILLCGVHLKSKVGISDWGQFAQSLYLPPLIQAIEQDIKAAQCFVFGDFNATPFDPLLLNREAFHAVPCKATAKNFVWSNNGNKPFYNPTWHLLQNETTDLNIPVASIYSNKNKDWADGSAFDGFLLRPSDLIVVKEIKYLSACNNHIFFKNGRITVEDVLITKKYKPQNDSTEIEFEIVRKKSVYSDHLPLFVHLNILNNDNNDLA